MPRIPTVLASLAVILLVAGTVMASEPRQKSQGKGKAHSCSECGDGCSSCGRGCTGPGCRRGKHHRLYDGQEPWANCGCNGSYKYPVPPLYTYHWRGMASQRLMTNYHSPYRFPAIKPFEDEDTADDTIQLDAPPKYRNASRQNSAPKPPRRIRLNPNLLEKVASAPAKEPAKQPAESGVKRAALEQTLVSSSSSSDKADEPGKRKSTSTRIKISRVPLRNFIR